MTRTFEINPAFKTLYRDGEYSIQSRDGKTYAWGSADFPTAEYFNIPPKLTTKERIKEQKTLLIENTALFLTTQSIWEQTCGQLSNTKFYRELLDEAKETAFIRGQTTERALRPLLFREIKKVDLSKSYIPLLTRTSLYLRAFLKYFFYNNVIKYCANLCISTHLNKFDAYIEQQGEEDDFVSLRGRFTENLNRCLTIFSGAYTNVTQTSAPTGTIEEMVARELAQPSSNGGLSSKKLYRKVAARVMCTSLGTIKGTLTGLCLKPFFDPETVVEALVQTSIQSAHDNQGYSHSINTLILDQLKQVEYLLRHPQTSPTTADPLSDEKKRQLSTIVNQLMEILNKTECKTVDELTHLVQGKGFWPSVQTRHVETFAVSQIMESIVLLLANLQQAFDEDQIDELKSQLLKTTNDSFSSPVEVSRDVMRNTENELAKTTRKILKLTIDSGIYGALTSTDPCFGSYYIPHPIAMTKKALSTVRFLPSLFKPVPLALMGALSAPFLSENAADYTLSFAQKYNFEYLIKGYVSAAQADIVQNFIHDNALNAGLYIGLPLISLYGLYSAIHSRATFRATQLFRLSSQPNMYLSALHHLLFIPHLRAMNAL